MNESNPIDGYAEEMNSGFDRLFDYETGINEGINPSFINFIKLTNCTITFNYTVPNIINIGGGDYGHPIFHTVRENSISNLGGITQIILTENISSSDEVIIVAKNDIYEFSRRLELKPINSIYGFENISGYYDDIIFENKFWISDGSDWHFSIKLNNAVIITKQLSQNTVSSMLYDRLDETPFIINNLRYAELFNQYTFRCIKEETEIIVIYYRADSSTPYVPALYLIPNNRNSEYIDIGISWNDESLKGSYIFRSYKINELPSEETVHTDITWVLVR